MIFLIGVRKYVTSQTIDKCFSLEWFCRRFVGRNTILTCERCIMSTLLRTTNGEITSRYMYTHILLLIRHEACYAIVLLGFYIHKRNLWNPITGFKIDKCYEFFTLDEITHTLNIFHNNYYKRFISNHFIIMLLVLMYCTE